MAGQHEVGRCTLSPPYPQLKGAWYPGGFKPLPLNIIPGFKMCLSKSACATTTRYAAYIRVNITGNRFDCPIPGSLGYMGLLCYSPENDASSFGNRTGTGDGILGAAVGRCTLTPPDP